jgi:hypothetical protein
MFKIEENQNNFAKFVFWKIQVITTFAFHHVGCPITPKTNKLGHMVGQEIVIQLVLDKCKRETMSVHI